MGSEMCIRDSPPPPPPGVDPVEEGGLGRGDGQVVDGGKNKGTLC